MIVGLKERQFYNAICLLYSAGLCAGEVPALKIKHIDGKGGKDRYTLLSERLLKGNMGHVFEGLYANIPKISHYAHIGRYCSKPGIRVVYFAFDNTVLCK